MDAHSSTVSPSSYRQGAVMLSVPHGSDLEKDIRERINEDEEVDLAEIQEPIVSLSYS